MWRETKIERAAESLSKRWFVRSICGSGLFLLDARQGFLTARICFDSVIEVQTPFGEPKSRIPLI